MSKGGEIKMHSIESVANKLNVSRETVFRWIWNGYLKHEIVDGQMSISDQALKKFEKIGKSKGYQITF